ncbi:MAG: transposase [Gemmatimonadales bacterium]
MHKQHSRHHIRHTENAGRTCHITWRLARTQSPLTPGERTVVLEVMRRGQEFGCLFHAAAVMDDHVHALVTPGNAATSSRLLRAWKAASSHALVKQFGRTAPLWQPEYYQRWIQQPGNIEICAEYIHANPERRWPGIEDYPWILP